MHITDDRPVCVIGDVMLDRHVYGKVRKISPEASVPVLEEPAEQLKPGGAANVAANISAMGGKARLLGLVGMDKYAQELQELMDRQYGCHHVRHTLLRHPDRRTTVKLRYYGCDGRQLLRVDRDCNATGTESQEILTALMRNPLIDGCGALALSDYGKGCLSFSVCQSLIQSARLASIPVLLDTKQDPLDWKDLTLVKPNAETAMSIWRRRIGTTPPDPSSMTGLSRLACGLAERSGVTLLVTGGAVGMALAKWSPSGVTVHTSHGIPGQVRSVVGAGDSVFACMAACVASGVAIDEAVFLSNVAGSVAVQGEGTTQVSRCELVQQMLSVRSQPVGKVLTNLNTLSFIRSGWEDRNLRVVFVSGCFDLMHYGHHHLLEKAAGFGDRLVVGINSDASVHRLKGDFRPVVPIAERERAVASLPFVDLVVPFAEDTPESLIKRVKPLILVRGQEESVGPLPGADTVVSRGGRVVQVPRIHDLSTTSLLAGKKTG